MNPKFISLLPQYADHYQKIRTTHADTVIQYTELLNSIQKRIDDAGKTCEEEMEHLFTIIQEHCEMDRTTAEALIKEEL